MAAEDALLGSDHDRVIAKRIGRSESAVTTRPGEVRIPSPRGPAATGNGVGSTRRRPGWSARGFTS
jgi:hypothetical protein